MAFPTEVGRHTQGAETASLRGQIQHLAIEKQKSIEWMGEYRNTDIIQQVFNNCDAIVVPSIWVENSPLVIHEALQARVPVITANSGGMAEYIHHEQNGLLFAHRDPLSLAEQMQRFVDHPHFATQLGERGYRQAADRNIPGIQHYIQVLETLYEHVIANRKKESIKR